MGLLVRVVLDKMVLFEIVYFVGGSSMVEVFFLEG